MTSAVAERPDDIAPSLDWRIWGRVVRRHPRYLPHAIGLGIAAMAIAGCQVLLPLMTGQVVDQIQSAGNVRPALLGFMAAGAGLAISILAYILLAGRIATGVSHDIRQLSFAKLQQLDFRYFDQRPVGWIMSRLTSDCDRLARIIGWSLLDFLWGTALVSGIAVMMLCLQWKLALIVLAVVPLLALISVWFQRRLLAAARQVRRANAELTAHFNESITGIQTTKALVREAGNLREFQSSADRMYEHSLASLLQSALYLPIVITLGSLAAGLALWQGGGLLQSQALSVGTLVTFLAYTGLFFDPIKDMAEQLTEMQMAQAAAERIESLLETQPEIHDDPQRLANWLPPTAAGAASDNAASDHDASDQDACAVQAARQSQPVGAGARELPQAIERLDIDAVHFAYEPNRPVLSDVSLSVARGQSIALVGPTGGGKSTLVNLLCRFYEPQQGSIRFNGIDYRQLPLQWLHSRLGMVLQAPYLFSDSVLENIRYGRLDASDEQVRGAARQARAEAFIERLEGGYEFQVGECGQRLSMGQRQLVSLARAVLADPQLLILDEATSSVDTETEHLIQQSIAGLLNDRISFIIAHRLSTIRRADRILVIENGRIVEDGSHQQLMARRGRYHALCVQQFA